MADEHPDIEEGLRIAVFATQAPPVPPGFFGDISFKYRDGELVAVHVHESWVVPRG